ncbi:MAG: hypothetical protein ACREUG_09690, partial [Steroidobacteraceae bacterium]
MLVVTRTRGFCGVAPESASGADEAALLLDELDELEELDELDEALAADDVAAPDAAVLSAAPAGLLA